MQNNQNNIDSKTLNVLFDLDGVITDTAKYHFIAWKEIANKLGIVIDEKFNENLKGVSREESLNRILSFGDKSLSKKMFSEYMDMKNKKYISLLDNLGPEDILPGIKELFMEIREHNGRIGIASASKNAPKILNKLKLEKYVDSIANPENIENSKPAPDIFLEAAKLIEVPIQNCIGIEDSLSGIKAINSSGALSIGIGLNLLDAKIRFKSTKDLTYSKIVQLIN